MNKTYEGRKVFLTGHTGFKGSWLLYWLHVLGAEVKGYSLDSEGDESLYQSILGHNLCHSVIADIRHSDRLEKELLTFQPDFIFHLAAQPLVRRSYEMPDYTFEVNAMGTSYLLSALRKLDKPCVVILVTTDKVYENKEWIYPYREVDRLGGHDPYSASKACAELIIKSQIASFFPQSHYPIHQKAIGVARSGNVIGGGDFSKDRIIPDIIRALRNEEIIKVRNPNSVRPWQHVLEPTGAYLCLGKKLSDDPNLSGEAWNFGPLQKDHITVERLVNEAIRIWGKGNYQNLILKDQPHEAQQLKLDISKSMEKLGWAPKLASNEAIQWALEWYKTSRSDIAEFTKDQILTYSSL